MKPQKSLIYKVFRKELPPEVYTAWVQAKQSVRSGTPEPDLFTNQRGGYDGDGSPLPKPAKGYLYRKFQVGSAHEGDPRKLGVRRLVLEVHKHNGDVGESYYTDDHYTKGSFIRIL